MQVDAPLKLRFLEKQLTLLIATQRNIWKGLIHWERNDRIGGKGESVG